jgi:hypothetical protein
MKLNQFVIFTIISLVISACSLGTGQFNRQDLPVTALQKDDSDLYAKITPNGDFPWLHDWNLFLGEALDSHGVSLLDEKIIPVDQMNTLCPGFFGATVPEKKAVWALLFASIARYESGFDPNIRYQEGPDLHYIYSEGLLQLSYGDQLNHQNCLIDNNLKNILDPKVNLQCGVAIMRDQLRVRKVIFTDKHYYWSVLTNKRPQITAFFNKYVDQLPFCNQTPSEP